MTWWTWDDAHGSLVERVEGQLLDIGAGGCRLETAVPLDIGSVGVVEIGGLEAPVAEAVRVCHMIERPGAAARYVLQVQFLPLPLSLRAPARVAMRGRGGDAPGAAGDDR